MKRLIAAIVALALLLSVAPVFAAQGQRGASASAYENASDKSIFNRTTDWFSTVGRSQEEKDRILAEREAKRAAKRAERDIKRAQKQLENESRMTEKKMKRGMAGMK